MILLASIRTTYCMRKYAYVCACYAGNTVSANEAPALKLADLTENAFSLKPCTFFQTHFHVRSGQGRGG